MGWKPTDARVCAPGLKGAEKGFGGWNWAEWKTDDKRAGIGRGTVGADMIRLGLKRVAGCLARGRGAGYRGGGMLCR